jgi:hypothetical protein
MFSLTRSLKMGYVPREGFMFLSLTRLTQTGYVLGLSVVISLLLFSPPSHGQFRGNQMPPPMMMPQLNNQMTDDVAAAMFMGSIGSSGGMMMGGMGMMGMMGMSGMMMGGMGMGACP